MLLRLEVHGFKNLLHAEIRFGPLTCFVGANGAGKSNIFDAIQLLKHLAAEGIQHAGEMVRSPVAGRFGPAELFSGYDSSGEIRLVADMIVPQSATDEFGQTVEPSTSLLQYEVRLRCERDPGERLVLAYESLRPLKKGEAPQHIGFDHHRCFRETAISGQRRGGPFISTDESDPMHPIIKLHADGGSRGRPVNPGNSPNTVLGGTGSADYPTIVAAKREMSSWTSLHLEPSSLRTPDEYGSRSRLNEYGRHLASNLHRLARDNGHPLDESNPIYVEAANRLSRLVPSVRDLRVRIDKVREQYVLEVKLEGVRGWLQPRSLSDGTLRFLALTTMELDAQSNSVICIEEPENGVDPFKIPDLVDLLRDFAVDPNIEVDRDNPLRQVILNSHSPDVLKHLHPNEVLFVDRVRRSGQDLAYIRPVKLKSSWRTDSRPVTIAELRQRLRGAPCGHKMRAQLELFDDE